MTAPKAPGTRLRETKQWSDAERANALTILASCGGNCEAASRECGVPARTIAAWRDKPMSGGLRASVGVREELLGQSLERLMWRLLRSAKGKITDAKLPAVLNGMGTLFDRWRLLRSNPTIADGDAAKSGLDLSKLSAVELRQLLALTEKAGGNAVALGLSDIPAQGAIVDVTPRPGDEDDESWAGEPQANRETDTDIQDQSVGE